MSEPVMWLLIFGGAVIWIVYNAYSSVRAEFAYMSQRRHQESIDELDRIREAVYRLEESRKDGIHQERSAAIAEHQKIDPITIAATATCVVCKAEVTGPPMAICPKCHATAHHDCWEFNDKKCGRFGCSCP